jgi:O-antigen/teichoic acid export membrane protein
MSATEAPSGAAADVPALAAPSLATRVLRGGALSLLSNLASQLLRFGSNLVLTRLLFPEAFGLMAIAQSILAAARLLSDVGLTQSIVRSARGDDQRFCDTVWTLNIIKDGALCALICALAPSVAHLYDQPKLSQLVPAMAATILFSAFNATKIALVNRRLAFGRLIPIELGAQLTGIMVMIAWAMVDRSPWALVAGNWASTLVTLACSHFALDGPRNRFAWDPHAIQEVFGFGTWVMLSSMVTFLLGEGSNLLNGWLVGARAVGFIALSTNLALVAWGTVQGITGRVFFPAYAEVWRERPDDLPRVVARSRRVQLAVGVAVALILVLLAPQMIALLYDQRYRYVGALLQVQAVGTIFAFVSSSYSGVLWATGHGHLNAQVVGFQAASLFVLLIVGSHLGGVLGLMTASSFIGICLYPFNSWVFGKLGLWQPRIDSIVFLVGIFAAAYVYFCGAWRVMSF